ncbi:hypothetical protein IKX12_01145 [Candidatus Saccharibacteria bacterium]|nr:hypothetical protein [Candidatus Saccharibacteria bacterium]
MSFLTEFYLSNPYNPIIMLLICWLFWPGSMFFSAAVFESRKVYLGKGQSRMFFPGDFFLGVTIVAIIGANAKNPVGWTQVDEPIYWLATGILCAAIAVAVHIPDAGRYKAVGSRTSPTKLTHDFFGYFICPWLMASRGLPELFWCVETLDFSKSPVEWIVILVSFSSFMAFTVYDIKHPPTDEQRLLMHPDKYRPIWKKRD